MGILSGLTNKLKNKASGTAAAAGPSYQSLLAALAQVKDPDLQQDIVSLGFVRNLRWQAGCVTFELNLTTPACPVKDELVAQCEQVLKQLPLVEAVQVTVTAYPSSSEQASGRAPGEHPAPAAASPTPGAATSRRGAAGPQSQGQTTAAQPLAKVRHIIAVASGKGGVGKSTTAVNLAFSMAAAGARVGLLDADVYGPSLPLMTGVGSPEAMAGGLVVPPEVAGVKVISVAMFTAAEKAQMLRGPMAANLVKQFLNQVAWGELDYLVIDYPPGTGDIQLTISQVANVTAAVMVTTPQEVALLDVRKAMAMFTTMKVPVVGIIETMSYFVCDGCDKKHFIFKQGGGRALSQSSGLPLLGEIPLDTRVAESSDAGTPIVLQAGGDSVVGAAYRDASARVVRELAILANQAQGALSSFTLNWRS